MTRTPLTAIVTIIVFALAIASPPLQASTTYGQYRYSSYRFHYNGDGCRDNDHDGDGDHDDDDNHGGTQGPPGPTGP